MQTRQPRAVAFHSVRVSTLVLVRQCSTRSDACQNSAHSTAASSGRIAAIHQSILFVFPQGSVVLLPLDLFRQPLDLVIESNSRASVFHSLKNSCWMRRMRNPDRWALEFVSSVPVWIIPFILLHGLDLKWQPIGKAIFICLAVTVEIVTIVSFIGDFSLGCSLRITYLVAVGKLQNFSAFGDPRP